MWNNEFGYYPPMMRGCGCGKYYDDNLCLYYEKEKVYYDNRYPECLKDALKNLECQQVDITLANGEIYIDVTLDEVLRDYIAIRKNDNGSVCLIPFHQISAICISAEIAKGLWGCKVKKCMYPKEEYKGKENIAYMANENLPTKPIENIYKPAKKENKYYYK